MKYLIQLIYICLLVGILSSCKKEEAEPNLKDPYIGEWEWIIYTSGPGGTPETPASLGITKTLLIDQTTFSVLINDTLQSSSTYEIKTASNSHFSWHYFQLTSGGGYNIYSVSADTLKLTNLFVDFDIYARK